MVVVSVFDGMSCGHLALVKAGFKIDQYFAYEIDKHAIVVTQKNFPETIQRGDVTKATTSDLPKIDLFIGGSPCQGFSFSGKMKGMVTKENVEITSLNYYLQLKKEGFEFDGQSYLFWEYIRVLRELQKVNPAILFLLENVQMQAKWKKIISTELGINPIEINSALLSAQNRERLYWTNIASEPYGFFGDLHCAIPQPRDKGIFLKSILETEIPAKYYWSEKMLNYFKKRAANFNNAKVNIRDENGKASTLTSSMSSCDISDNFIKMDTTLKPSINQQKAGCLTGGGNSGGLHSDMTLIIHNPMPRTSKSGKGGTGPLSRNNGKTYCLRTDNKNVIQLNPSKESGGQQPYQQNRVYDTNGKNPALTTIWNGGNNILENGTRIRRLTPIECERLQTVPDNYTNHVSDTQRYKMLGNGWTVDVIAYIFSFIKF